MNKIAKPFYFVPILIAVIFQSTFTLMKLIGYSPLYPYFNKAVYVISWLLTIYSVIIVLILWYKAWQTIQDKYARTKPDDAILFIFIPLFNLYWLFQLLWGFSRDYNSFVRRHKMNVKKLPEGLFLTLVILLLLGIVGLIFNYFGLAYSAPVFNNDLACSISLFDLELAHEISTFDCIFAYSIFIFFLSLVVINITCNGVNAIRQFSSTNVDVAVKPYRTLNSFRRTEMWIAVIVIISLIIFSIAGSFKGAEKASQIFNFLPLVNYWLFFVALLIAGLLTFPRLLRKPGLLLIHLGCIVILLGAMWSSEKGHFVQKKIFGKEKIPQGHMIVFAGQQKNRILKDNTNLDLGEIPFYIHNEDFWIDYHWEPGILYVLYDPTVSESNAASPHSPIGRNESSPHSAPLPRKNSNQVTDAGGKSPQMQTKIWKVSAQVGEEQELPDPIRKVRILKIIRNLKNIGGGQITDRPRDQLNHALYIQFEWADGKKNKTYVFPPGSGHPTGGMGFEFVYMPGKIEGVKDYYSDLVVLDYENQVQHREIIEVNKPLHYGGYHFYQTSYGLNKSGTRWFTYLGVVSDSGVSVVFLGYWLLCAGVFWQCWIRHIFAYFRNRSQNGN